MRILLIVIALAVVVASTATDFVDEWHHWKVHHRKSYCSEDEESGRYQVWLDNRELVKNHNKHALHHGYSLHLNHFGDLTDNEFEEQFLTYQQTPTAHLGLRQYQPQQSIQKLPMEVDWRRSNAVTNVKEQGWCGSSYAFSAIGAIEGAWAIQRGRLRNLSAQNIIDCSVKYGNLGCRGGNMHTAFEYVFKNAGVDKESAYPYKALQSSCEFTRTGVGAKINGTQVVEQNEEHLQEAVATMGPVTVAVDASSSAFRFYYKGIYDSATCSQVKLNHAMLVVGYSNSSYQDYWVVKNSWGTNWGQEGYVYMTRNMYNQCGIATDASFPTVRRRRST